MLLTYMCFLPDSISAGLFADLIDSRDLGFAAQTLHIKGLGSPGADYPPDALDKLRSASRLISMGLEGPDGSFRFGGIAGWPAELLILKTKDWPPEQLIDRVSRIPGFTTALVGDQDDLQWQSIDQINNYEALGKPWKHLPTVWDEVFECYNIDVSSNPGRQTPFPGMWLWAASKMWFGPEAFAWIDPDRLRESPAVSIETRPDGLVIVDLFGVGDDIASIRVAQSEFREWMDYEGLDKKARHFAAQLMNSNESSSEGSDGSGMQ